MRYFILFLRKANFLLLAIILLTVSTTVYSAGFQISEQSGTGLGRAFAGFGVIGDDLSMAFYNPAGLTMQKGTQIQVTGYVIDGKSRFSNEDPPNNSFQSFAGGTLIIPTSGNNEDGGTTSLVLNLFFVMDFTPKLKYGFAVTAPYGLKTDYDRRWVGRFHADESELKTVNINPSLAYKFNDVFSVGAGVSAQYANATLSRALSNGPGAPEGFAEVEGDDWGYGWSIGLMYHPSATFRAGIGYRSKISHKLDGGNNEITGVPALGGNFRSSASARATLPETVHAGVYKEFASKWGASLGFRWTRWNRFDELRIQTRGLSDDVTPEDWENAVSANIGVDYFYSDKWTFRAGYMFDETPVPDKTRTPRIPDEDRHWVAIGATLKATSKLNIDFGYTHLFIEDADLNVTVPIAAGAGTDTLVGEYKDPEVDIISLQAIYKF